MKAKEKKEEIKNRCEGWVRHGGIFTLGPVTWKQCENEGIVMLTVKQDGKTEELPACKEYWKKVLSEGIEVLKAVPIED